MNLSSRFYEFKRTTRLVASLFLNLNLTVEMSECKRKFYGKSFFSVIKFFFSDSLRLSNPLSFTDVITLLEAK